jgi:hypothetical protein
LKTTTTQWFSFCLKQVFCWSWWQLINNFHFEFRSSTNRHYQKCKSDKFLFPDIKTFIKTELKNPSVLSLISNPDSLESKVLGLWMPKFAITTKVGLKNALSQRPELKEFFSDRADYSRMAKEQVKVQEVHHTVILFLCINICQYIVIFLSHSQIKYIKYL